MRSTARLSCKPIRGPLEGPHVYLTFDDGPDPDWTPRVLDALAAAGASATFFLIGQAALQCPALVRRAASEGHAIGNHSWSHRHPWLLPEAAARAEVRDGAAAIADIVGREIRMFRPPHGRLRRCMTEEAEGLGASVVLWSRSAVDWGWMGYPIGISRRLRGVTAGDIVLMHDARRTINRPDATMRILPAELHRMRERGLLPALLDGRAVP